MKTLYDLLGARPDDDAEGLRIAFRKAAKASREGFHAGNPDAPRRFTQIVEAYDILRDAERRAIYDRLLECERGQRCSKLRRAVSYLVHNIISDAIGVVGLVVVLAGGHTLFAYPSKSPIDAVEINARGPAAVTGIRPGSRVGVTEPDAPGDRRVTVLDMPKPASNADALAVDGSGTSRIGAAKIDNAFAALVDQNRAQSGEVQPPSQGKDNGVPKSSSSDFAKSDDKPDRKIRDTRNIPTHDLKRPEAKITGRREVEPKQPAKNRTPVKQAALENRKTLACSPPQACSHDEPPLFGVGY